MMPMNVEIIDSRDNPKMAYVIVNHCKVQVMKAKLDDFCYILETIGNVCHLTLDLTDCEKEPLNE